MTSTYKFNLGRRFIRIYTDLNLNIIITSNAGKNARIAKLAMDIHALSHAKSSNLTVLAVARPEKGQVCTAGIDENGEWIRPQGVYESDVFSSGSEKFKTFGISKVYVDAWRGRHPRKEDASLDLWMANAQILEEE